MKNLVKIAANFLPSARAITEVHSWCQFNITRQDIAKTTANCAVDEHGIGQGNVEAVFDDGGGHEHVVFVVHEGEHDTFEFGLDRIR